MKNKKSAPYIILLVIVGCLIMAWVDAVLSPNYAVKSVIKITLFLLLPAIYSLTNKQLSFKDLFNFNKKRLVFSVLLGLAVYLFIIGAYFLIGPYFNFSNVTTALQHNIGVNKNNFIFVALYISFINSLLEEFFFRGFAFLTLRKLTNRRFSYIFSASCFSLYHIAIMTSWFTPLLYILLISSLFIAGILFNWLDEKSGNIYTSWMVHMCANFSINTVGFILFGLL